LNTGCQCLIPNTQEAEIRRITVQSQPQQVVHQTISQKNPSQKRAGGVVQGVGLEFKPQYCKKEKKMVPIQRSQTSHKIFFKNIKLNLAILRIYIYKEKT
jgi:hypothetical protein